MTNKIRAVVHILRGKPTMYRMHVGMVTIASDCALVTECTFDSSVTPTDPATHWSIWTLRRSWLRRLDDAVLGRLGFAN